MRARLKPLDVNSQSQPLPAHQQENPAALYSSRAIVPCGLDQVVIVERMRLLGFTLCVGRRWQDRELTKLGQSITIIRYPRFSPPVEAPSGAPAYRSKEAGAEARLPATGDSGAISAVAGFTV